MTYSIFVSRQIPLSQEDFPADWDVQTWPLHRSPSPSELREACHHCHGLISMLSDTIDREFFDACPKLKAVAQFAVGLNNIDLATARARSISISNTPDVLTEASANHAMALILSLARLLKPASLAASRGEWIGWEPLGFLGKDLSECRLAIIGLGRIGQALARKMHRAFGLEVLTLERPSLKLDQLDFPLQALPLDELLASADIVSLHVPLTSDTHHLLGARELALMKKDALLVNTARGEVIDQDALINRLKAGHFFGVGLDVTTPEPLPKEHPLYQFERVLITPHIASAETQTRRAMALMALNNLKRDLAR